MSLKQQKTSSLLLLLVTAILWSMSGLLIKSIHAHPLAIAGARSAIASLVLLIYIRKPKFTWSFPQLAAAFMYSLTVITFVAANKNTTAANAILIQYTAPVYVAFFGAWLLKEKPKPMDWATIAVVLCGMVLFFMGDLDTRGAWGNILAAISGMAFGMFPIFMRMQKDGSPIESVLLGNVLTAVVGVPFLFSSVPDTTGWIYLGILGTFQLGLSYILYSIAIKQVTALESSLITVIEPILNPVWVLLFMGETPGLFPIIGGIIVGHL
ncbi:MAG: EamA family transporter [Thermoclostridium sp.]|nr:EamA family transporter [Thermoclostridium sp.]